MTSSEIVKASKVLFIKLGRGGNWEKDCIEKDQTIRLGFREANHEHCLQGKWEKIKQCYISHFTKRGNDNPNRDANRTANEIRYFYEEPESTLWITFYANRMWWCFAKPKIIQLTDKTKIRKVSGKWSDCDINGRTLLTDNLSGKLLRTQGYRGTICSVKETQYVLSKINGKELQEVTEAKTALAKLEERLSALIKHLHWKDFETLVDLLFRQAGWQRVGQLGKTQKTLDLDLLSPVTNERAIVQIKSSSNADEFSSCVADFDNMQGYKTLFYVVHSPDTSLLRIRPHKNVRLILLNDMTRLSINAGLTEWIISKSS